MPPTAIKPSYGIAEATLFVSTIAPTAGATVAHLDREKLEKGEAVRGRRGHARRAAHVSCGQIARSQWCVIVDPESGTELPDGRVGEIWLHGNNVGRGYWGRPEETRQTFGAVLRSDTARSGHAHGVPADAKWLRTGDLGFYLDGELYVTGRIADLITIDGRQLYPEDVEVTTAEASPIVRRGYVRRVHGARPTTGEQLVIVAERASGTRRADPGSGRRRHSRRSVTPTRPLGRRCPSRARGRHPAHDERQAGPPGLP